MRSEEERLGGVRRLLREAVPALVACSEVQGDGGRADLCLLGPDASFVLVEVKAVRAPRIAEVEGQLARAVLQLRRYAGERQAVLVALVSLGRFGSRLAQAVRAFMAQYAPGVGWGLLDQRERAVLVIPALGVDWERVPRPEDEGSLRYERRDRQLFTDLNRWMLKVLLLRKAPGSQWGGPRARPRHPTELAEIAAVSVSKAHQFTSAFQEEGYLRKSDDGLRLVRVPALLEAWLQDEKNTSPKRIPVRSPYPVPPPSPAGGSESEEPTLPPQAWPDAAIGGALAAESAGLSHVAVRQPPLVHVALPLSTALREWRLTSCDRRDAQMILSRPLFPQSVFRGVVRREGGAPLVDLWQIALDARSSAARGREQAEYIRDRVLALQGES